MNNVEYIPLEINEVIGGSNKILNFLNNKNIIIILVAIALVAFLLIQNKNKHKVKSTTTNNTVSISKRIDSDGKAVFKKTVNGEEEEMTKEDHEMIMATEEQAEVITTEAINQAA